VYLADDGPDAVSQRIRAGCIVNRSTQASCCRSQTAHCAFIRTVYRVYLTSQ